MSISISISISISMGLKSYIFEYVCTGYFVTSSGAQVIDSNGFLTNATLTGIEAQVLTPA